MARDNQRQQNRDRRPRSTNNEEEILKITEVIFANYEEIIKKQ